MMLTTMVSAITLRKEIVWDRDKVKDRVKDKVRARVRVRARAEAKVMARVMDTVKAMVRAKEPVSLTKTMTASVTISQPRPASRWQEATIENNRRLSQGGSLCFFEGYFLSAACCLFPYLY